MRSFEYLRKDLAFLRLLKLLLTTSMAELVTTVTQMCVVAALMSWRRSTLETSSAALLNGDRQATAAEATAASLRWLCSRRLGR